MMAELAWNCLLSECLGIGGKKPWRAFVTAACPVILSAVPHWADAEWARDFAQSVFLKLVEDNCRRLRTFDASLGVPFPAYLRVIAVRCRIDWCRSRRARDMRHEVDLSAVAETLGVYPDAEDQLEARELHDAVEKLSPQQRLATQLILEGMSVKEVALALGLSDGGAAALLWRARQGLRELLSITT